MIDDSVYPLGQQPGTAHRPGKRRTIIRRIAGKVDCDVRRGETRAAST